MLTTNPRARLPCLLLTLFIFLLPGCQTGPPKGTASPEALPPTALPTAIARPATAPPPSPTATPAPLEYTTPAWFENAVLYEIFVRSFADSNGDGIGDLAGITAHLDYIAALGANAIWLMPIYPSPSEHGYDVTDFYGVNPAYGTHQDLEELVAAAHARGIRVILDFVPSHLSSQNKLFTEAYDHPGSSRTAWFVFTNEQNTAYATFAGNTAMPRFNHFNPEVAAYLIDAALFWLDLDGGGNGEYRYTGGIDGFRVDNATFPPAEFFVALRQGLKAANPEALLLGEAWVKRTSDLAIFYDNQFDALFDFPLYQLFSGDPGSNNDALLAGKGFPALLASLLEEEAKRFPPEAITVRFLSNHDTNRLASELEGDPARLRLAAAVLAALPQAAMIYYGEEIGMPGIKGGPPFWDNYRREPLDWYAPGEGPGQPTWFRPPDRWNQPNDGISVEEQENDPASLLNFYRKVFRLRQEYLTLATDATPLDLSAETGGPWALWRTGGGVDVVAVFNFGKEPAEITLHAFPFTSGQLIDLLSGQTYPESHKDGDYTLTLPGGGVVWLIAGEN